MFLTICGCCFYTLQNKFTKKKIQNKLTKQIHLWQCLVRDEIVKRIEILMIEYFFIKVIK